MAVKSPSPTDHEQELLQEILSYKYDPLGFVLFAFPWGVRGTPLERFPQPRDWQVEELEKIRRHLEDDKFRVSVGLDPEVYYLAISSGRGTGKSAFLSMLDIWMMSCWIGSTNIVTANTESQLKSRTFAELGKWVTMAINAHWFEKSTMSLRPSAWFKDVLNVQLKMDTQYYYVDAQSWSDDNPDAFAGAHSQVAMMVQFDEASGISDQIWEVSQGFFTDVSGLRIWAVISNPRRNTGKFYDCFHIEKDMWNTRYIDSRDVDGLDRAVFDRMIERYGEDSDIVRTDVKGEFPRVGSNQFIGRDDVDDAVVRELVKDESEPLIMGVDVGRFGNDPSVIRFRRGRDARSIKPYKYVGLDTMGLANECAKLIDRYNPDAVMVDGGGVGGGVVDRLKELGYRIIEIQSGKSPYDKNTYLNKRVEMWGLMREWLKIGCIDDDPELAIDLTAPEYSFTPQGQIKLESKDDMRKRGLDSTDDADALAFTFGEKVYRRLYRQRDELSSYADMDYDELGG